MPTVKTGCCFRSGLWVKMTNALSAFPKLSNIIRIVMSIYFYRQCWCMQRGRSTCPRRERIRRCLRILQLSRFGPFRSRMKSDQPCSHTQIQRGKHLGLRTIKRNSTKIYLEFTVQNFQFNPNCVGIFLKSFFQPKNFINNTTFDFKS